MGIRKIKYFLAMALFVAFLALPLISSQLASSAFAATTIAITSPTDGQTVTGSSFTITGTATPVHNISVSINGNTVGTTISDSSGNWSVDVTGQSEGAKTITATASADLLYTNLPYTTSFPDSRMAVINTIDKSEESSFVIYDASSIPLVWKPSPDFTKAYGTSPYLNSATVWSMDLTNGTVSTFTMSGTTPRAASIAFNADGSKVYIADNQNHVDHVYNTSDNSEVGSPISIGTSPHGSLYRPGTNYIVVAGSASNDMSVIDTTTDTNIFTFSVGTAPNATAFNSDGSKLYVGVNIGDVQVIDATNGSVISTISGSGDGDIENMVVSSDGKRLYGTHPSSNTVDVFDLEAGSLLTTITVDTGPWSVALSSDDTKLYVTNPNLLGSLSGTRISVIDTATNTVVDTITPGQGAPFFAFINPVSATTSIGVTLASSTTSSSTLADTGMSAQNIIFLASGLVVLGGSLLVSRLVKLQR